MSQAHGQSLWQEPAGSGATPAVTAMVLKLVAGAWQHVAGAVPDAVAMDRGDGAYTITAVTDPLYDATAAALRFVLVRNVIQSY